MGPYLHRQCFSRDSPRECSPTEGTMRQQPSSYLHFHEGMVDGCLCCLQVLKKTGNLLLLVRYCLCRTC